MEQKERYDRVSVMSMADMEEEKRPLLLEEVMRVETEAWPEEVRATIDKFESRLAVFPQGFFLGKVAPYGLMGVSTSEIIDFDYHLPPTSWEEITDNGYIRATHKPTGNALYVVSVGVSRKVEKLGIKGVGTALISAQKELATRLGLNFVVLGARISGLGSFASSHPQVLVEDYLRLKRGNGETLDPEIRFYERNGFKVLKVVPNYMENDPESLNYGAVMVWERP